MWESIYLGTPGMAIQSAISEDWFHDEVENFRMGFGKGFLGRAHARDILDEAVSHGMGIYHGTEPIGIVVLREKPTETKSLVVWAYVKPSARNTGAGPVALMRLIDDLFGRYKRIEVDVLQINKSAVALLKKAGFTQEGTRRTAHWMHGDGYNVLPFRMLQKHWKSMKRKKVTYGRNAA